MTPSRSRLLLAALAALLLAGGGTLILAGGHPTALARHLPAPSPTPSAPTATGIAVYSGPFNSGPVAAPAAGALLGAWVRPATLSQTSRITAVRDLEGVLGRRLDIVNTYRRFDDPFPTASDMAFASDGTILMLSWVIDDTRVISSGALDARLHDWARRIRDLGSPVLLRLRWEMDRPNLAQAMWSGPDYVQAWKHVRGVFAAEQVDNVSWVWCPTADGFATGHARSFYPGDDQVDWTCVDVYAGARLQPLGELLRPFLSWAAKHPKPIVIGEFGVARAWGAATRAAWLADAARVFQANPQIKAVSYFDSDPSGTGGGATARFQLDGEALRAFASLARMAYFNPNRR